MAACPSRTRLRPQPLKARGRARTSLPPTADTPAPTAPRSPTRPPSPASPQGRGHSPSEGSHTDAPHPGRHPSHTPLAPLVFFPVSGFAPRTPAAAPGSGSAQPGSRDAGRPRKAQPGLKPPDPRPPPDPLSPRSNDLGPPTRPLPVPAPHRQLLLPLHELCQLPPGVRDLRRRRLVMHRHVGLRRAAAAPGLRRFLRAAARQGAPA